MRWYVLKCSVRFLNVAEGMEVLKIIIMVVRRHIIVPDVG